MERPDPDPDLLLEEVALLRREVARLNNNRFVRVHNSMSRLIAFQLARGLAFGLGTVLGATVLLSLVVWALSSVDFIPIVGGWAHEILVILQPPE